VDPLAFADRAAPRSCLAPVKEVIDFIPVLPCRPGAIAALEQAPRWPDRSSGVRGQRELHGAGPEAGGMPVSKLRWPSICGCPATGAREAG